MKKIVAVLLMAVLACALLGCQRDDGESGVNGTDLEKAQAIAVVAAGQEQVTHTISDKADLEDFVARLDLDHMTTVETVPEDATALGTFIFSQEDTIHFGETSTDGTMDAIAQLTLYDDGIVQMAVGGLSVPFGVSEEAAAYLEGFFSDSQP